MGGGGFGERAQSPFGAGRAQSQNARRGPTTIEGELVAKSSATSAMQRGQRVFHVKFGPGSIYAVDGNKLTWTMNMKVPMPMTLEAEATIDGDALTGTIKAGAFGSMAMTGTRQA